MNKTSDIHMTLAESIRCQTEYYNNDDNDIDDNGYILTLCYVLCCRGLSLNGRPLLYTVYIYYIYIRTRFF